MYYLHIVAGIYGSGKTTFCKNKNMLSIDDITNYDKLIVDYDKITDWIELNKQIHTDFYLDGYIFDIDPTLSKLQSVIGNEFIISIIFLYANDIFLYRDAFNQKLSNGLIFIELSRMTNQELAYHIREKILHLIKIIYNLPKTITYLCRTRDNIIETSSINNMLVFLNNILLIY